MTLQIFLKFWIGHHLHLTLANILFFMNLKSMAWFLIVHLCCWVFGGSGQYISDWVVGIDWVERGFLGDMIAFHWYRISNIIWFDFFDCEIIDGDLMLLGFRGGFIIWGLRTLLRLESLIFGYLLSYLTESVTPFTSPHYHPFPSKHPYPASIQPISNSNPLNSICHRLNLPYKSSTQN